MFGNTDATPRLDVMYLEQESNCISSLSRQIILIGHLTHCSDGLVNRLCNILYRTLAMLNSNPNMVLNGVPMNVQAPPHTLFIVSMQALQV